MRCSSAAHVRRGARNDGSGGAVERDPLAGESRWVAAAGADDVGHAVRLGRRWRRCECSAVGDDGGGDGEAIGPRAGGRSTGRISPRCAARSDGTVSFAPHNETTVDSEGRRLECNGIYTMHGRSRETGAPDESYAGKATHRRGVSDSKIHRSSVEKELGR